MKDNDKEIELSEFLEKDQDFMTTILECSGISRDFPVPKVNYGVTLIPTTLFKSQS